VVNWLVAVAGIPKVHKRFKRQESSVLRGYTVSLEVILEAILITPCYLPVSAHLPQILHYIYEDHEIYRGSVAMGQ
jgi:hypothetical protein